MICGFTCLYAVQSVIEMDLMISNEDLDRNLPIFPFMFYNTGVWMVSILAHLNFQTYDKQCDVRDR